jgi:hypothetical protein
MAKYAELRWSTDELPASSSKSTSSSPLSVLSDLSSDHIEATSILALKSPEEIAAIKAKYAQKHKKVAKYAQKHKKVAANSGAEHVVMPPENPQEIAAIKAKYAKKIHSEKDNVTDAVTLATETAQVLKQIKKPEEIAAIKAKYAEATGPRMQIMTRRSNGVYVGDYKDGLEHGLGKTFFGHKRRHEGEYLNGKMHGCGKMYYKNGSMFQGKYKGATACRDEYIHMHVLTYSVLRIHICL